MRWRTAAALLALNLVHGVNAAPAMHGMQLGDTAPDFLRNDIAGKAVHLSDFRGKLVLLNFWASWCGPCLKEMPTFAHWQRVYGDRGLQVIGIAMDDDVASARHLLARRPVPYPVVGGDATLGTEYGGVLGLPLTYLIDPRGRVIGRFQGGDLKGLELRIKTSLPAIAK